MADEIMIDPMIFHGPGCCPECGGPLVVADSELTLMELNQDGIPMSEETAIRCEATCMHCSNRIKMMRWKGGYVPYSRTSLILKTMELRDEIEDRKKLLNKKSNPFF